MTLCPLLNASVLVYFPFQRSFVVLPPFLCSFSLWLMSCTSFPGSWSMSKGPFERPFPSPFLILLTPMRSSSSPDPFARLRSLVYKMEVCQCSFLHVIFGQRIGTFFRHISVGNVPLFHLTRGRFASPKGFIIFVFFLLPGRFRCPVCTLTARVPFFCYFPILYSAFRRVDPEPLDYFPMLDGRFVFFFR